MSAYAQEFNAKIDFPMKFQSRFSYCQTGPFNCDKLLNFQKINKEDIEMNENVVLADAGIASIDCLSPFCRSATNCEYINLDGLHDEDGSDNVKT